MYTYDATNRLASSTSTSSSSPKETYEYDSRSNLVRVLFNSNQAQFRYDTDNLIREAKIHNQRASLIAHLEYDYYDIGPIRVTDRLKNSHKEYLFDLKGRLISVERGNDDQIKPRGGTLK